MTKPKRKSKRKLREWWVTLHYGTADKVPWLLTYSSRKAAKDCNNGEVFKVREVRR